MTIHRLGNDPATQAADPHDASASGSQRLAAQYAALTDRSAAASPAAASTIRRKPVPSQTGAPSTAVLSNGGISVPPQHLLNIAQGTEAPAHGASSPAAPTPPRSSPLSAAQLNVRDGALDALKNNHDYMRKAESQISQGKAGGAKGFFQKHIWHTNRFPTDIAGAKSAENTVKSHLTDLDALTRKTSGSPTDDEKDKIKSKTAELEKAVGDYNAKLSGVKKEDKNSRANDALKWGIGAATTPVTKLIP